jgi:hypothetical protein
MGSFIFHITAALSELERSRARIAACLLLASLTLSTIDQSAKPGGSR